MQTSSKRALGIVAVLILALAAYFLLRQPPVPDQDQIAAQLESARTAAEQHDLGGVMKIISADYKDSNGLNVDQLHFLLGRALRDSGRVQVQLSPPSITVQGDAATSVSQVTVRSLEGSATLFDKPVTLNWRREDGHRLLFLPAKVWRVVSAQYGGGLPGEE